MSFKEYASKEYIQEYFNAAKAYTDSQRLAYSEKHGTDISWDGDSTGKLVLKDALTQVSKMPTDLSQVESVASMVLVDVGGVLQSGTEYVLPLNEMVYQRLDEYTDVLMAGDSIFVGSCTKEHYVDAFDVNVPAGTYFASSEAAYVSRLIMKETIHPIDPKYLPKGGVGYEDKTTLTYDGVIDGKTYFESDGSYMVRVGDIVDGNAITSITAVVGGSPVTVLKGEFEVQDNGSGTIGVVLTAGSFSGSIPVLIFNDGNAMGVSAGTYFADAPSIGMYTAELIAETIHPIDPKYLPAGVGDNSVILDLNQLRLSFNTLFSGTEIPLGAEQIALADYAFKNKSDIVIVKDDSVGELYTDITKFRMTLNRVAYQDADGTNENVMEYSGMFFTSTGGGIVTLGLAYKTNLSSGVILGRALDITASTEV